MRNILSKILNALRGRHRSISYRFVFLTKERFKLLSSKLLGRSWIDYYAKYIDRSPREVLVADPTYLSVGKEFLETLKEQGLKPEHYLLDFGCGILRGGLYFIPYLEKKRYTGVDISSTRLMQGAELMDENDIHRGRYEVIRVKDCSLTELEHRRFDYVWAHAVLPHMPEDDIRQLLQQLKSHLNPNATILFTYFASEMLGQDKAVVDQIRDYYYPTAHLEQLFKDEGYDFSLLPRGEYSENWGVRARAGLI